MSGVYGRGLSESTLAAFGALSTSEQGSGYAAASAADAAAALGASLPRARRASIGR